ncbi:beta strand repeat-containing protein, partial [Microbulbifer sp.]|uniref:beta strand repeat-containing protein n=1 Tax=Microbulbifer sp. TaxID=1908541 RepID=UPI003F30C491
GIAAEDKTYDGTTDATLNASGAGFTGMVAGDTLTVATASGAFADKNAGSDKTVSISGLTLGGGDAGNYTLDSDIATTTADIDKASIAAITGIAAEDKTYDGTTDATLDASGAGFTGMVAGDTLTVATASGTFADKNAGSDKMVNITGLTLGGGDAGNYTLDSDTATTSADIDKAGIAAITGIAAEDKTYDGTTDATLDASGAGFTGMVAGDTLTVATATGTFADKNAGSDKTVAISGLTLGGDDAGNYTLADDTATTSANIDQASLTLSTGDVTKTYDGTTEADGTATVVAGDLFGDDSLAGGSFAFTDKNAGTGKTVTVADVTLNDGNGGNNYSVTYADNTTSTIDKAALTVTANDANKTYDGQAFTGGNGVSYAGFVAGEDESVLGGSLSFGGDAQNAVNAGSYNLTADGLAADNYDISYTGGTLTVDQAIIANITGITAEDKTYDGTTAATLDASGAGFTDIVSGDTLTVATASGAFADKNAGSDKTVSITGLALGGDDAGNYTLADDTATTSADIDKAALTVTANDADKTYDGLAFSGGNGVTYDGFVADENESVLGGGLSFGGTAQGAVDAGTYTLTASGFTSNNYDIAYNDGTLTVSSSVSAPEDAMIKQTLEFASSA